MVVKTIGLCMVIHGRGIMVKGSTVNRFGMTVHSISSIHIRSVHIAGTLGIEAITGGAGIATVAFLGRVIGAFLQDGPEPGRLPGIVNPIGLPPDHRGPVLTVMMAMRMLLQSWPTVLSHLMYWVARVLIGPTRRPGLRKCGRIQIVSFSSW